MKHIKELFARLPLRNKLIMLMVFVGSLPLLILSLSNYYVSQDIIIKNASSTLETVILKNEDLMLQWMSHIEDEANMFSVDGDMIAIMNNTDFLNKSDIIHNNLTLKRILNKYFLGLDGVYSYHLYTDKYVMVGNLADPTAPNAKPTMFIPYEGFQETSLYKEAQKANGRLVWIPTYSISEMYGSSAENAIDNKAELLFSAVKQINCLSTVGNESFQPVLVISFLPDYLDNMLMDNSLIANDANYYIYSDDDNRIIYDCRHACITEPIPDELLTIDNENKNGTYSVYQTKRELIASGLIKNINWHQIISVPTDSYTHEMKVIPNILFTISILLTIILCIIVYSITGEISNNFGVVMQGIQSFGDGDLNTRIPEINDCEFDVLAKSFNKMGDQMQTLITENYETKLRESETQIMALNLQMNPHFLYNTLNSINWMAIEKDETEISDALVHLSKMLQYSFRNKKVLCSVEEEIEWLQDYLYIMKLRFADKFTVRQNIDESLLKTEVPRLMLQPLFENSIVHGFEDIEEGGEIVITANMTEDSKRLFVVQDNGHGMSKEVIESVLNKSTSRIGLANLNNRLKILYADTYDLKIESIPNEGTTILITLP